MATNKLFDFDVILSPPLAGGDKGEGDHPRLHPPPSRGRRLLYFRMNTNKCNSNATRFALSALRHGVENAGRSEKVGGSDLS